MKNKKFLKNRSKGFYITFWGFLLVFLVVGIAGAVSVLNDQGLTTPKVNDIIYVIPGDASDLDTKLTALTENDTLIIPKGYYRLTDCSPPAAGVYPIVENSITIKGEGKGTHIHFDCINDTPISAMIRVTGDYFLIKDIYFQGNQTDNITENGFNKTQTILSLVSSDNSIINNLWFLDGLQAISISSSDNVIVSNINIKNTEHPFNIQGSTTNLIINNIIASQFARDGRNGYLQTGMKISNTANRISINNFHLNGYQREAFRISGGTNLQFSNIYLNGTGNYDLSTPTTASFNFINSSDIQISNLHIFNGKDDINIDDVDEFSNLIITNMFLKNTTEGISIRAGDNNISNIKISDSIILFTTGGRGIDIRNNNLTDIEFNNVKVYPFDPTGTTGKAIAISVNDVKGLSLINSKFNGATGDFDVASTVNHKIRIINSQFKDDDVRGAKFSDTTVWNFTEFTGNYFGTDDNPTYYGDVSDNYLKVSNQRTGTIAYNFTSNTPVHYDGTDWNEY